MLGKIIVTVITGTVSVLLFIYTCFTAKGKGPLFSNAYFYATPKQRKEQNWEDEYKLVTKIFRFLSLIFACISLNAITGWNWLSVLVVILCIAVVIYAIVISIKSSFKQ